MRDDDPEDLLGELFDEALFGDHPLGRPVIGSEESVRGMDRDDAARVLARPVHAPRMVVAAAGNLRPRRASSTWSRTALRGRGGPGERRAARRARGARAAALRPRAAARCCARGHRAGPRAAGRAPGSARHDPRRPALSVLNTALGGGPSSRLFQQVREQRGLAYSVYSSTARYADAGSLCVYAGCASGAARRGRDGRAGRARRRRRGRADRPPRCARAQGNLRGGLVLGLEDTPSRMNRLGRSEIDHGRQRTLAESLDRIAAVTPSDVAALARELLTRPFTAAVVGPFDDEDALPASLR